MSEFILLGDAWFFVQERRFLMSSELFCPTSFHDVCFPYTRLVEEQ